MMKFGSKMIVAGAMAVLIGAVAPLSSARAQVGAPKLGQILACIGAKLCVIQYDQELRRCFQCDYNSFLDGIQALAPNDNNPADIACLAPMDPDQTATYAINNAGDCEAKALIDLNQCVGVGTWIIGRPGRSFGGAR